MATVAIVAVIALELVHVGRRLDVASAPNDLQITATIFAFLTGALVAVVSAAAIIDALAHAFGRPFTTSLNTLAFTAAACAVFAAMLAIVSGALRPLLPDLTPIGARIAALVSIADPVPVAALAFRTLERSATLVSTGFALFEQRAGVWLAIVLIGAVVVWAVR
jgi:hypothetical protein